VSTHTGKVSLYIPCRNAEKHLEKTLRSVFSQTHPLLEVIAVDDGSEDRTGEILESYGVRVVRHQEPMGITRARNTALHHARGEFLASVDADVVLEPDWLEKIMTNFSEGFVGGVGGRIVERNVDSLVGRWILAHRNPDKGETKLVPPALPTTAVVYRRKTLLEIGGFNDDKRYDHSDLDASMRAVMIGYRLVYEPEATCYHYFQGDIRRLFDGMWRFKKDAYVNCGLFVNPFGLRRKVEINLGEFYQMLMDDFGAGRRTIMPLDIIGALRHSLMDIRLYCRLHPDHIRGLEGDTFGALKLGLRYILEQKEAVSGPLAADILREIWDISVDSAREGALSESAGGNGNVGLSGFLRARFPRADLERVSEWLTMFLGFLNSFPDEIWESMNRPAEQAGRSMTDQG